MWHKLAGRHKHFRMAVVIETLNCALSADLGPAAAVANASHIWEFLDTLYDMEKVIIACHFASYINVSSRERFVFLTLASRTEVEKISLIFALHRDYAFRLCLCFYILGQYK
jgi:hypothetical protein